MSHKFAVPDRRIPSLEHIWVLTFWPVGYILRGCQWTLREHQTRKRYHNTTTTLPRGVAASASGSCADTGAGTAKGRAPGKVAKAAGFNALAASVTPGVAVNGKPP